MQLDGETALLTPEELLIKESERPGLATAAEGGYVVALDTELTPELFYEGLVRDFVRQVQNGRKLAGLEINDRIAVGYQGSGDSGRPLRADDYARAETLADSIAFTDEPEPAGLRSTGRRRAGVRSNR
ncbi:MAG: DUF5915 domain-containing protein [Chloroflexia bacterium]